MKHATSVFLLFLCILNTSLISVSNPNDCDASDKTRKFVSNCYNTPKTEFKVEVQEDDCRSYFVCKDKKFSLQDCGKKDGKQQYFQNGKCTPKPPTSCKLGCNDTMYEYFLLQCKLGSQYILNGYDNCQSVYLCKNSTLSSVNCNNPKGEKLAIVGCQSRDNCGASAQDTMVKKDSDPSCESNEKWRNFISNCYNQPKIQFKVECQTDGCNSYFVCKDRKLILEDCEKKGGKPQYFQNGKCTPKPPSCKRGCYDELYDHFLVQCIATEGVGQYIVNGFDNCQSVYICENSTLRLVNCLNTWPEDELGNAGCKFQYDCAPHIG